MVAELRDRKAHLEKELEYINIALEALEKAWTIDACLTNDDAIVNNFTTEKPSPARPVEANGLSYADAAERVLERVTDHRAISTRTLIMRLGVAGKRVKGKDPYRTLYRTLQKDRRFVRIEGKWALADWYPSAPPPPLNEGEKKAKDETLN
jgi:hypothetical protein